MERLELLKRIACLGYAAIESVFPGDEHIYNKFCEMNRFDFVLSLDEERANELLDYLEGK